jgi:single-strand DNA-binding protein
MSSSLNKVMVIGNLGKDPEVRTTPSGAKVANFSIATNEGYTDKSGQKVDRTEWHHIVMWRGLADIAERYLHKGSTVYAEGKLMTRSWDDPNGQKRYTTEIMVDNMQMLGGQSSDKSANNGNFTQPEPKPQSKQQHSNGHSMPSAPEDDLPF